MSEFAVEVKIKSGVLYRAIKEAGYATVAEFCRAHGLSQAAVGRLLNLRESPMNKSGRWTPDAQRVADALNHLPDDLFPDAVRVQLERNKAAFYLDAQEAALLAADHIDPVLRRDFLLKLFERADLSEREKKVLSLIHQHDFTLEQAGAAINVTRTRAQQIEVRALCKLRDAAERHGMASDGYALIDVAFDGKNEEREVGRAE